MIFCYVVISYSTVSILTVTDWLCKELNPYQVFLRKDFYFQKKCTCYTMLMQVCIPRFLLLSNIASFALLGFYCVVALLALHYQAFIAWQHCQLFITRLVMLLALLDLHYQACNAWQHCQVCIDNFALAGLQCQAFVDHRLLKNFFPFVVDVLRSAQMLQTKSLIRVSNVIQ